MKGILLFARIMIYPVRVDVTSKDGQVRLTDSMLLDSTCLPIPPCPKLKHDININDVMNATIDTNSKHLAETLLADMEVQSCSRIQKNGRVKLFTAYPELKPRVEDQIACQLRVILEKERFPSSRKRKRKLIASADGEENDDTKKEDSPTSKKNNDDTDTLRSNTVKVNIRIRDNQISVVDELMVDPNDRKLSNPLSLAESIAKDLNLPYSMINTIAVSIAEQVHGLQVDEKVDGMLKIENGMMKEVPATQQIDENVPCAWSFHKDEQSALETNYQTMTKTTCNNSK